MYILYIVNNIIYTSIDSYYIIYIYGLLGLNIFFMKKVCCWWVLLQDTEKLICWIVDFVVIIRFKKQDVVNAI